jgi:hypothetical protein
MKLIGSALVLAFVLMSQDDGRTWWLRQHRRYSMCSMSLGICTQQCMRSS